MDVTTPPEVPAAEGSEDWNDFGMSERGAEGSTTSAADVAESRTQETEAAQVPPPAPADPNLDPGARRSQPAPQQGQAAAPAWQGVREVAEQYGYKFGADVADDPAALRHLIQRANSAQKSDYYSEIGRQIAPHASKFQQFLQQQQAPSASTASPWDKPEFDPRWASVVERDPATGVYVGKPGVPSEIVQKVNAYAEWVDRRDNDPEGYATHVAKKVFAEQFAEQFEQRSRQIEQTNAITDIQRQNASWLYQHDDQGRMVFGYDGKPVASPGGQRYLQHVQAVARMGVADPRHQDLLARQALQAEVLQSQYARQGQAAQQAANPQTQQAQVRPNQNPLGTLPASQRAANPAATEPTTVARSLADVLRANMAELSDSDFTLD